MLLPRAFALAILLPRIHFLQISTRLSPSSLGGFRSVLVASTQGVLPLYMNLNHSPPLTVHLGALPFFHRTHHHRMHYKLIHGLVYCPSPLWLHINSRRTRAYFSQNTSSAPHRPLTYTFVEWLKFLYSYLFSQPPHWIKFSL